MLGSWSWEEELELGERITTNRTATTPEERDTLRRESPDSTHPVPDSRVLRYVPSRCYHPPATVFDESNFSEQPPLSSKDCKCYFNILIDNESIESNGTFRRASWRGQHVDCTSRDARQTREIRIGRGRERCRDRR